MATRTVSVLLCLALSSCSDLETTGESGRDAQTSETPTSNASHSESRAQLHLTVERARNVLQTAEPRLQFTQQDGVLSWIPETSILYATLEEDGLTATINIGSRGQFAEFTHLKVALETQEEGVSFIADEYVDQYVAGFLRKASQDGEAVWAELIQQPDLLGVASETSLIQRVETERCLLTLARRGSVEKAKFQQVDFDITTREYQKEVDALIQRLGSRRK